MSGSAVGNTETASAGVPMSSTVAPSRAAWGAVALWVVAEGGDWERTCQAWVWETEQGTGSSGRVGEGGVGGISLTVPVPTP